MDRPEHPQPQPCRSRQRLSRLPLLRERALGNCLPMTICQWRQVLAAVGRVMGLGGGERVPVLGWALAVVLGREEAVDRARGQVAVASQPAP